ncbi:MAG: rhodanese-like domain-containing protein [Planctomycetota bacterium]
MTLHAARSFALLAAAVLLLTGCSDAAPEADAPATPAAALVKPQSFISGAQLVELKKAHSDLVLIDARSPANFAKGHIAGALNMPPDLWRTKKAKIGQGPSRVLYRQGELTDPDYANAPVDTAYYAKLLGTHGIARTTPVVVYGNHAGKADGSVPAMILDMLGHETVYFLDGIGVTEWQAAGQPIETGAGFVTVSPVTYEPQYAERAVWTLNDVMENLDRDDVVFYDTRTEAEFLGTDHRSNARKGRLPNAVRIDYTALMANYNAKDFSAKNAEALRKLHVEAGITPDKHIVLYCQTATRVSLPYLVLKDLGYPNVHIYDASWFEYGNRDDTVIETGS